MSSFNFHPKFHGSNHYTISVPGYPDSGTDPIASSQRPFAGDFYLNGTLSAHGIITQSLSATYLVQSNTYIQVLSVGGIATTVISVTGNYQTQNTDYVVFTHGGALSSIVTLPPASAVPNQEFTFKRTSSTSSVILSVAKIGTLIEAQYDSILLNVQYSTVVLLSYQNNWWIIYNSY